MTLDPHQVPSERDASADDVRVAAYEAALAVASEVDLDAVLQRITDLARRVVRARYGALGVADDRGRVVRFFVSGLTEAEQAELGPFPEGHGLLGALIRDRRPLMVPDIGADPRSVGFPTNHPPMRSLLGVPILLGDRPLGNLYLTDRLDGRSFTADDLDAVQIMAAHAATAIDRAHLYRALAESRQRAEEQRDHLHVILDNLPSGVLIQASPDGRIELANAAATDLLLGPRAPTGAFPVAGRDYHLLQDDGSPLRPEVRPGMRALRGETVRNRQLVLERWDGARLPVLVQASPLRDAQRRVTGAVVVIQDVTRLREAEQLKDDFIALISHEFRTPLTTIQGGARLLAAEDAGLTTSTRGELLNDVVEESDRLNRMLGNMLSLAAIQAGRLDPATEPVLVGPLARQIGREVADRAPRHRFEVEVPPALPPAEGDPELLGQVLRNLYENAVKYAPAGGVVLTSAEARGRWVTIGVSDEGVGIAAEHVPHVFERFRRPGADPTVRGMGLGLYLSRLLVEAQGGTISAASAGPGQGATFRISLPIAEGWEDATDEAAGSQILDSTPATGEGG